MPFYHGTSTLADIDNEILPPEEHNFGINEEGRIKYSRKVFFTTVKGYAEKYARQAVRRAGGEPVVYEVFPLNPKLMTKVAGCDVYFDCKASVGDIFKIKHGLRRRRKENKTKRKEINNV